MYAIGILCLPGKFSPDTDGPSSHRILFQPEKGKGKFHPFIHAAAVAGVAESVSREIHALNQRCP